MKASQSSNYSYDCCVYVIRESLAQIRYNRFATGVGIAIRTADESEVRIKNLNALLLEAMLSQLTDVQARPHLGVRFCITVHS